MTGKEVAEAMRERSYEKILDRLETEGITDDCGAEKRDEILSRSIAAAELRLMNVQSAIGSLGKLVDTAEYQSSGDYCDLGAARWLIGDRSQAISDWGQALKCQYGDGAGNLTPSMLRFYAAVCTDDLELKMASVDDINKKLKSGWSKNWPAPLGRYLLDIVEVEDVEQELCGEHPKRQPDEYCRFDFYRGVKCLEAGLKQPAVTFFQSAVDRPMQKTWTTEFVLACHEVT